MIARTKQKTALLLLIFYLYATTHGADYLETRSLYLYLPFSPCLLFFPLSVPTGVECIHVFIVACSFVYSLLPNCRIEFIVVVIVCLIFRRALVFAQRH